MAKMDNGPCERRIRSLSVHDVMKNPLNHNTMRSFTSPREHGAREWSTFNAVRGDKTETYPVSAPQKPREPRSPGIIKIIPSHGKFTPRPAN